jgi:hypothetical protein
MMMMMNRSTPYSSSSVTTATMLLSLLAVLMTTFPSTMFVLAKPLRYRSSNNINNNYEGGGNAVGRVRTGRLRNPSSLWNSFGMTGDDGDNSNDNDNDNYFVTTQATLRERGEDESAEFFMALNSITTASSMPSLSPTASMVPSFLPSLSSLPSQDPSVSSFPSEEPSLSSIPSGEPSLSSIPSEEPSLSSIPSNIPTITGDPIEIDEADISSDPPSTSASLVPSNSPSFEPSHSPTNLPPTESPTFFSTTFFPTAFFPTLFPSASLSSNPSASPSTSANPSLSPTLKGCSKLTSEERELLILAVLDKEGNSALIRDRTTPQGKATNWIINEDEFQLCPYDKKLIQRWVLAVFYYSTAGQNWNITVTSTSTPFLSNVDECLWFGIKCTTVVDEECVQQIRFEKNNLSGTIPTELGLLTELAVIEMEQGTTSGTIPSELGQLDNMVFIDMDFNMLTGTLPMELYQLTKLNTLDLNNNKLTGAIDAAIGEMVDLNFVQLQYNMFTGTIPTEFGLLKKLETFNVHVNQFEKKTSMPTEVCELRNILTKKGDIQLESLIASCGGCRGPKIRCRTPECCTQCICANN